MKFERILIVTLRLALLVGMTGLVSTRGAASQVSPEHRRAGASETYIILYKNNSVPPDAAARIAKAGGTLIHAYDRIGVVMARSADPLFLNGLKPDSRVEGASATAGFGVQIDHDVKVLDDGVLLNAPVSDTDPYSIWQWNMIQIHVPEAHAITGGSPSVIVGDIDTGLDYTHQDLAANVDFAHSVSCLGGVPDRNPEAWMDDNGHGTLTAGIIAASENGVGIVGVAPNVKIAGIKAADSAGYIFPEAVVCSFMWAGDHEIDVTNNSYIVDPWMFNCRNDPEQRAIWKAVQRAIRYAMSRGVVVVAALGNQNLDLTGKKMDTLSPDDSDAPLSREVNDACVAIPAEVAGVIGVAASGCLMQKSYYSNYGVGVTELVAPGGDYPFQNTGYPTYGQVLSTCPGNQYGLAQGTSMAAPHVAGVAALIISRFGPMPQGSVRAIIANSADPLDCPQNPFNPGLLFRFLAVCHGGIGYNGFSGHGQVNALRAILR